MLLMGADKMAKKGSRINKKSFKNYLSTLANIGTKLTVIEYYLKMKEISFSTN